MSGDTDRAEYDPFGDRISVVQEPPGWSGDTDRAVEAGLPGTIRTLAEVLRSNGIPLAKWLPSGAAGHLTDQDYDGLAADLRAVLSGSPRSDTALDVAWREAEAALPEGARIVTTEHVDEGIAFAVVTGDHIVRNVLAYDYEPAPECIAWGAADNPTDALEQLAERLAALR